MLMSHASTVVVEADEFDRSFHQLHPAIAAITAMDADHLDIYGDLAHVHEAFRIFASQVSEALILKLDLPIAPEDTPAKIFSYHFDNPRADFHSSNLRLDPTGHYTYDLVYPGGILTDIRVGALGWVNVENSIAAAAICLCCGLDAQKVRHAIGTFEGAQRRLDLHVGTPELTYIDDYAHHPAELESAISSIRRIYPGRKITGIFQPHLYTRTRDFASEFARALSGLDKLILLDIYPAREEPIPGVTSEIIFRDVTAPEKVLLQRDELMPYLEKEPVDVLVTLGAGNIDRFIGPITDMLNKRL
jgi:UDP-N-acetylmuramate--alanine ligase